MADHALVQIHVTSFGNDVALEIARMIAESFADCGVRVETAIDQTPDVEEPDSLPLIVAPHEYFPLFLDRHRSKADVDRICRRSFLLCVEQPGSRWFEVALPYARSSRGVFDISREAVVEFRRRGIWALHVPLGYAAALGVPSNASSRERTIDIVFVGHSSPRRELFFARHAQFFSTRRCRIIFTNAAEPRHADTPGYYGGERRAALLGRAKILLNVHSSDRQYFEWHRGLLAIAHQCLLITEWSGDTSPLLDGRHFASDRLDRLPALCERYLDAPEDLTRVATAGHEFAKSTLTISRTGAALLSGIEASQARVRPATVALEPRRRSVQVRLQSALDTRRRGSADWKTSHNRAYLAGSSAAVSVVVPLFNYERFIGTCLRSVLAADPVHGGIELVVVDDKSTDNSAEAVGQIMRDADVPMLLVRKMSNTGLADTRNVGLAQARGAHVFMLDADNWIFPPCLATLEHAWEPGLAAVYALIQQVDEGTGEALGLLSPREWNVRDLVRRPYIDAMALLDRETVLSVGGYSTELIDHGWFGWEDYDLWLKLAEAGHRCKLEPQILCAYRAHADSMIHQTDATTDRIARYFQKKFGGLAARHADLDQHFGFPSSGVQRGFANLAVDSLEQRCMDLEGEMTALRQSMSWRITRPLRAVFRTVTRRPH